MISLLNCYNSFLRPSSLLRSRWGMVLCLCLFIGIGSRESFAQTNLVSTRINADKMSLDYDQGIIYLQGNVIVADPNGMLYADNATVYLEREEDAEDVSAPIQVQSGMGSFYRVVAMGNVRMTASDRSAISDKAVWDRETNTIVLTGGPPMLRQGSSYIEATRIIYYVHTQLVEFYPDPRVVIHDIDDETKARFFQ